MKRQGHNFRACSSQSRKTFRSQSSLPFSRTVEIFSAIRMRKKYYRPDDCLDRAWMAGYNPSGDGRATRHSFFRPHPARRRGDFPTGQP